LKENAAIQYAISSELVTDKMDCYEVVLKSGLTGTVCPGAIISYWLGALQSLMLYTLDIYLLIVIITTLCRKIANAVRNQLKNLLGLH